MALVTINWQPTDRQLRQFGAIALVALPLLGWFWGGRPVVLGILAGVGLVLAAIGWIRPSAIRPVYLGLCLAAIPIGIVVGELALLLVFFGLFLPIGLWFRLIGRDPLRREFDRDADTYWETKRQPTETASYLRPW